MQKYVVSVSKKNNSIWKIYFYDENFEIWKKEMEDIRPNHFKDSDGHHNQIRESFSASSQFKCEGCNG